MGTKKFHISNVLPGAPIFQEICKDIHKPYKTLPINY